MERGVRYHDGRVDPVRFWSEANLSKVPVAQNDSRLNRFGRDEPVKGQRG